MTRYRSSFQTPEQAVSEALFLGLMAPDDEKGAGVTFHHGGTAQRTSGS